MKLAFVTSYPPSKVTLNEYAFHLVKSFRKQNELTELILLTDRTSKAKDLNFEEEGCKVTVKECWSFNSYKNIFSILKAINQVKPDAILFNLQFMKFGDKKLPAALGLCLPLICKIKEIPTIVLLHNILELVDLKKAGFTSNNTLEYLYNYIGTKLTQLILKVDLVAVTMNKYATTLSNKYKCKNVKVIPHGTFELPPKPLPKLIHDPLKIMTFGKFGTYKKVEYLIEAVEIVRKRTNKVLEIVIAGTDNPNALGYLDNVKEKYSNIKNVTFTGYVQEEDVEKIFNDSAVVVFPYTSTTGSSGVLHQAGSYGKAVIMPNLGDLSILIDEEGYRAEFFEPENIESLADAIENVVIHDAYRNDLGEANYKAATAFPVERITKMYLNEFSKIIQKKSINKTISKPSII
jgi:glycosyltransferase involved in cell wall biosynthesis